LLTGAVSLCAELAAAFELLPEVRCAPPHSPLFC